MRFGISGPCSQIVDILCGLLLLVVNTSGVCTHVHMHVLCVCCTQEEYVLGLCMCVVPFPASPHHKKLLMHGCWQAVGMLGLQAPPEGGEGRRGEGAGQHVFVA